MTLSPRSGAVTAESLSSDLAAKQAAIKSKAQLAVLQSLVDELNEKLRVSKENQAIDLAAQEARLKLEYEKELEGSSRVCSRRRHHSSSRK